MTLLNPAYALIVPFLFIFTLPLALFATLTTTLAFAILLFRVTLIYVELALAVIPHYLLGLTSSSHSTSSSPFASTRASPTTSTRRRKRRTSSSSTLSVSGGTITPTAIDTATTLGISQSIGPTRDFEGVGGWRLGDASDDDALWTNINSRLELPAHHERRHQRSLTGEGNPSAKGVMNTARVRTPPSQASVFGGEGYFPQVISPTQTTSPKLKRSASGIAGASGSSVSSKVCSGLGMKQR